MQQGMYFHAQLDRSAYVTQMFPILRGELSPARFHEAWQTVANRHDVFKTAFVADEGALHQLVVDQVSVPFREEDWRELSEAEQAERFEQYRLADKQAGFDLEQPGLQRLSIIRIADDRWQMLWTHHHLLLDGWSIPLVYQEVMAAYERVALALPADFEQYMRWLQTRDLDEAHAWWSSVLGEHESTTPLGVDKLPAEDVTEFREAGFVFSDEESQRLDAFARGQQTTLNTVMQLAWGYLLHRYSGENDVVFGTVISGRPAEVSRIEEMIGLFINAIPVKVSFGDKAETGALLGRIHRAFQESQQFGFLPLPEVQRRSRVRAGEPLFDTVMAFENYPLETALTSDAAPAQTFAIEKSTAEEGRTNYKLVLVASYRAALKLRCDYRSDQFSAATIARLLEHLTTILRRLPQAASVAEIDILGDAERAQLAAWNETAAPRPQGSVHELFEEQAAKTPHAIAVVHGDRTITYQQLDHAANALAHQLLGARVVGIRMQRSIEEIVAVLAAWKAGSAYVPLDPGYPKDRLSFMIADAEATIVLTEADVNVRQASARPAMTPAEAAYIIYTSGSTGLPKGVPNTHAALANLCAWHHRTFQPTQNSVGAHLVSISFDPSVYDVWPYLLAGARVAIVSDAERADAMLLSERFERDGITHCIFPTALLEHLAHQDVPAQRWRTLEAIIVGGEKLSGYRVPKGSRARLVNHYGPTEAAVVATTFEVTPDFDGAPPIGTPIDNVTTLVLNGDLQLVPVGVAGELYIGGAGLALGYLHRPELTAEKFVSLSPPALSPRGEERVPKAGEGSRLYRTGDLVRRLPDGNLQFLGRVDDQVKIRGFRIEPGEITARLLEIVKEAVVIAKDQRLIAYVVGDAEAARAQLRQTLPEYMIPSAFVVMSALPLTANGKVDRKALPEPEFVAAGTLAPRTATESELVAVWQELLRYAPAGADDHFFEHGGHSLLASQAIARIRRRCNVELPLLALFENPTPAALARVIDATRGALAAPAAIEPLRDYSDVPLSFAQQRLWFIEQYEQGTTSYNINMTLEVGGDFDIDVFLRALAAVARRQWSLRTRFVAVDGGARQEIVDTIALPVRVIEASDAAEVAETLRFERALPFDMSTDLLWRGVIINAGQEQHWIHFTIHHAITDGWSNGIFKAELVEAYETLLGGGDVDMTPLPLQYADYAAWQQQTLGEERMHALMTYWKQQLDGMPKFHSLPLDFPRPKELGRKGGAVPFELGPETFAALKAYCAQSGSTLYMALIAAFSVLVARLGGKDDVVLGTPVANRPSPELERVIGFFVNTVVLRVGVDGHSSFDQVVEQVRATTLAAQQHQELPFERLVAELQPERNPAGHPLFQLCFALNNTPGSNRSAIQAADVEEEHSAMFDLTLSLNELEDRLAGCFYFNAELFKKSSIEGLSAKLRKVLAAAVRDPKARVETIEIVEKLALPTIKRVAR
jgi:amino acid adenylation domain-containing protein